MSKRRDEQIARCNERGVEIRALLQSGRSFSAVARETGISVDWLREWVKLRGQRNWWARTAQRLEQQDRDTEARIAALRVELAELLERRRQRSYWAAEQARMAAIDSQTTDPMPGLSRQTCESLASSRPRA